MSTPNEDRLWSLARRRAGFKRSLYAYLVVNLFLWLVWWFTSGRVTGFTGIPWPMWVMLGWALSLARQYFDAYHGNKNDMADEEYQKLRRQQDNSPDQ